jgi:uncharacterized protein
MGKIVLFLVVLFVALFMLRLLNPRGRVSKSGRPPADSPPAQPRLDAEPMVACTKCGAMVPKSEAIIADQQPFCSREHAQARRSQDA